MQQQGRLIAAAVVLVAVIAAVAGMARSAGPGTAVPQDGAHRIGADTQRAAFTFDGVSPADRALVEQAIASARPEARRLVEIVDGLVTLRVADERGKALGVTQPLPDGRYDVTVDLERVNTIYGRRGVARVVLHELGHVVDDAIVPAALDAQLDAGIPRGYACEQGGVGSCAIREERFAESFAKWAMNDIGVDLYIGYKVAPPTLALSAWGAPLAALAG
jgi:hypothetical protein